MQNKGLTSYLLPSRKTANGKNETDYLPRHNMDRFLIHTVKERGKSKNIIYSIYTNNNNNNILTAT